MPPRGREIRVGLVILAALVVVAAGIFLIGDKNNLFSRKSRYHVEFDSVSGLKPGSPVQLDGVDVGTVEKVQLSEDPKRTQIRVWIRVDRDYGGRLRGPADPRALIQGQPSSRARLKTLGLLGDKFIEINSGSPVYPAIPEEGLILAAQPTNVDALISSGEDVMDNVVEISHSLNNILSRLEKGEGLLGDLTGETPSGQRLRASLIGTTESLERIANSVEHGEGALPRLLNDRAMADQLAQTLDRFESLADQAQNGPGLLPGLLNDPSSRTRFDDTLSSLNKVAQDLQKFTADLETSEALLPRLVKDEEYGREITEQLRQLVQRLNEISYKISDGQGTASKLINDPQIYQAVNDVIIGINESRVLRWLIRNRQKKGIDKRYEETKKAIEEQGGTPEPLDKGPDVVPETDPAESTSPPPADPAPAPSPTPPPPAAAARL